MTGDQGGMDPDDLDFTDDERVRQLEQDRYLISGGDGPPGESDPVEADAQTGREGPTQAEVSRWLADSFRDTGFEYGFDATLAVEGEVTRHRLVSNDLSTTFETLLAWFVRNTTTDATTEEALGILLTASDLAVEYPSGTLDEFLARRDLDREDSIASLLAAVDENGFRID